MEWFRGISAVFKMPGVERAQYKSTERGTGDGFGEKKEKKPF